MGNSCGCAGQSEFKLTSFADKNRYKPKVDSIKQTELHQILQQIVPSVLPLTHHIDLAKYIRQQKNAFFIDCHFQDLLYPLSNKQSSSYTNNNNNSAPKNSQHLHKLYNYTRMDISRLYSQLRTPYETYICGEIQLSYLATVFYLICNITAIKQHMFITKYVNKYQCYIVRMYCNGELVQVVVDDIIPTNKNQAISYISVIDGKQLWPMILEKAWCKQIGGYNKARGLSPEDCFEQITGIPANSFSFISYSRNNTIKMLQDALKKSHWVALTAKIIGKQVINIKSRQVFYLQTIKTYKGQQLNEQRQRRSSQHQTHKFIIRSAYPHNSMRQSSGRSSRQQLTLEKMEMEFGQILKYFQYFTIGYYAENFSTQSYPFKSNRLDDKIFILQIDPTPEQPLSFHNKNAENSAYNTFTQVPLNIRIIQFYEEYLSDIDKQFYQYSPVLMELYDEQYRLVEDCQSAYDGSRSTSLTNKSAFAKLKKGTYYLRVQICWLNPAKLCSANLLIYAPKTTTHNRLYTIKQYDTGQQSQLNNNKFASEIIAKCLLSSSTTIEKTNDNQQVKIRVLQKQARYILGIQNISDQLAHLKIMFKGSENLKVNHHHFKVQDGTLELKLQPFYQRVLELVPQDYKQQIYLAPFDIVKL